MTKYTEYSEHMTLPLIPLTGAVFAFPKISVTIDASSKVITNALEASEKSGSLLFLATQKEDSEDKLDIKRLYEIGTVARIKQLTKKNGSLVATLDSICRGTLINAFSVSGFYMCDIKTSEIEYEEFDKQEAEALLSVLKEKAKEAVRVFTAPSKDLLKEIDSAKELGFLADLVGATILTSQADKYLILSQIDWFERAELAIALIDKDIELLMTENNIKKRASKRIEEHQKEYFLREQLKAIQAELNDGEDVDEAEELYAKIVESKFPKNVEEKLLKELVKFKKAPFGSPESNVIRTYIETCLEIPFGKYSRDETSVVRARKILERDHYGLEKVKERILEFIAVKEMNPDIKNQIICLVGPPGVGKTSLCASIAEALKRKYVRVALGGIRDEAEIRGHRKTYIGAMPGRIINALRECKASNPLMVLDEIDKMTSNVHGDPASAMLEVLDSEQNKSFRDHYVEMDMDLSSCMFIATANSLDSIPRPLIDRMEVIELSSYTRVEKLNIAKNHLLPKQIKRHGITKRSFKLTDDAIYTLIDSYTAEAGVRNLEREIASLLRKAIKEIVEGKVKSVTINESNIENYLGIKKYDAEKIDEENQVGVVNGMAYTSIGGDVLKIEASVMKGTGKLQLTGKLGEVMRESCELAVSVIRQNAEVLGIDPDFYSKLDIHIHAPEGAVPKDGPSAGIAITTALVSVLTGRAIKRDISMTGEITLKGKVLPIGGLKEKALAAYAAGVKTIVIPQKNVKDLESIDKDIRNSLNFIPCDNIFDVLSVSFVDEEIIAIISQYTGSYKK